MISLAAQKFVSDIANDALQHCKMRGSGQSSRKSGKVSHTCNRCRSFINGQTPCKLTICKLTSLPGCV